MMLTSTPFPKPPSGCQLSTHMPLPLDSFISSPVMTRPYATLPILGHTITRPNYFCGIAHLPLSFPHTGTRAFSSCGHRCAGTEAKTPAPGEQLSRLVPVPPSPPLTALSRPPTSNRSPDNAHIISGRRSGFWIVGSHSSATVPPTTTLSPNHRMVATTLYSKQPSPLKNPQKTMSPSHAAQPAQPCG